MTDDTYRGLGVPYDDIPETTTDPTALTRSDFHRYINETHEIDGLPAFVEHGEDPKFPNAVGHYNGGRLMDDGHGGVYLLVDYSVNRETARRIENGELPEMSVQHDPITRKLTEISFVEKGWRPNTTSKKQITTNGYVLPHGTTIKASNDQINQAVLKAREEKKKKSYITDNNNNNKEETVKEETMSTAPENKTGPETKEVAKEPVKENKETKEVVKEEADESLNKAGTRNGDHMKALERLANSTHPDDVALVQEILKKQQQSKLNEKLASKAREDMILKVAKGFANSVDGARKPKVMEAMIAKATELLNTNPDLFNSLYDIQSEPDTKEKETPAEEAEEKEKEKEKGDVEMKTATTDQKPQTETAQPPAAAPKEEKYPAKDSSSSGRYMDPATYASLMDSFSRRAVPPTTGPVAQDTRPTKRIKAETLPQTDTKEPVLNRVFRQSGYLPLEVASKVLSIKANDNVHNGKVKTWLSKCNETINCIRRLSPNKSMHSIEGVGSLIPKDLKDLQNEQHYQQTTMTIDPAHLMKNEYGMWKNAFVHPKYAAY